MLMDHESAKLRSAEEAHQVEMREWRQELKPRKQVRLGVTVEGREGRRRIRSRCGSGDRSSNRANR